jgi:hypothetical protein
MNKKEIKRIALELAKIEPISVAVKDPYSHFSDVYNMWNSACHAIANALDLNDQDFSDFLDTCHYYSPANRFSKEDYHENR